jgi:hypothetical protein
MTADKKLLRRADQLVQSGAERLEHELLQEKAAALARLGERVETALRRLREHDDGGGSSDGREQLVREAARAVWEFLIQRELTGCRDDRQVIQHYGIPREVLSRLGQF